MSAGQGDTADSLLTEELSSALDIRYQVYTDKSGWLPMVKNIEDYAGVDGEPIKGIDLELDFMQNRTLKTVYAKQHDNGGRALSITLLYAVNINSG